MPRSVVVEPSFPIAPQPHVPWETTVIYEIHVKGFTKNMPGRAARSCAAPTPGLAHPASVSYLKDLGVTAVELLPVHAKCDEPFLTERGLTNYWGYSTLSFFAPEPSYATDASRERGAQAVVDEFRGMVSLCIRRVSRLFSTSSTTTRVRAATPAHPCPGAASTPTCTTVTPPRVRS